MDTGTVEIASLRLGCSAGEGACLESARVCYRWCDGTEGSRHLPPTASKFRYSDVLKMMRWVRRLRFFADALSRDRRDHCTSLAIPGPNAKLPPSVNLTVHKMINTT